MLSLHSLGFPATLTSSRYHSSSSYLNKNLSFIKEKIAGQQPFGSMLPAMFAKSASCIDPFIYSLNHPKIQREIAVRLYRRFVLRPPGMSNSAAGAGAAMTSTVLVRDLLLRPSLMSHRAVFQRFATNSSSPYYMSKSVDNICNRTDRPVSINSQQRHHQQQTRSCTFTQSLNRS